MPDIVTTQAPADGNTAVEALTALGTRARAQVVQNQQAAQLNYINLGKHVESFAAPTAQIAAPVVSPLVTLKLESSGDAKVQAFLHTNAVSTNAVEAARLQK